MWIKMHTTAAGPRLPGGMSLQAGHEYNVHDALGAELVRDGAAIEIPPEKLSPEQRQAHERQQAAERGRPRAEFATDERAETADDENRRQFGVDQPAGNRNVVDDQSVGENDSTFEQLSKQNKPRAKK